MELAANPFPLSAFTILIVLGLAVVQVGLDVVALVDLYRRPAAQVAAGNKWIWVAIIVLINYLGAILYFAVGRTRVAPADVSAQERRPPEQVEKIVDSLYGTRRPDDKQ